MTYDCCATVRPRPCPWHDDDPQLLPDRDTGPDPAPTWPAAELKVTLAQFTALILALAGVQCAVLLEQPWWLAGGSASAALTLLAGHRWGARRG